MRILKYASVISLLVGMLHASPDVRAEEDNREKQAIRKAQLLMRQAMEQKEALAQENASLNEMIAKLKEENAALKTASQKLDKVSKEGGGVKKELAICHDQAAAQTQELVTLRADYARLTTESTQSNAKWQEDRLKMDGEIRDTKNKLSTSTAMRNACSEHNIKMYNYTVELLDKYHKKGFVDILLQEEPVTQLKKVEVENIVQEYKSKIDQERLTNADN